MSNQDTVWVLLRGLGREHGHWGPFLDQFKAAFPCDEVHAIDMPGVGEFSRLRSPTNINDLYLFVRAQAVERSRSQAQFKLLAVSLGGMVAMEWMKNRPEDLAGAVMINTSARGFSPIYNRLRWQVWPRFLKLAATQAAKERERLLVDLLINSEEARAKALPLWIKLANENGVSYLNLASQLLAASRFSGLTEAPKIPVLLLSGLGDRFVDPSCSSVLHDKWQWPIERHSWAGHDLTWDDPEWAIQKIQAWNIGAKITVDTSRQ